MSRLIKIVAIFIFAVLFASPVLSCDGRCSDVQVKSWIWTSAQDQAQQPAEDSAEIITGPVVGKGHPFVGLSELDSGQCPGLDPYGGYGWDGRLIWPSIERTIKDSRQFSTTHSGIDIDMPIGTAVTAAEDGVIVYSGWSTWGFGNLVVIAHGGSWQSLYAHLSETAVTCGQYVNPGHLMGFSGQTGAATWPHLHFEIRNYPAGYPEAYNPLPLITN